MWCDKSAFRRTATDLYPPSPLPPPTHPPLWALGPGSVRVWNNEHPDKGVRVGDFIVSTFGIDLATGRGIVELARGGRLQLTIRQGQESRAVLRLHASSGSFLFPPCRGSAAKGCCWRLRRFLLGAASPPWRGGGGRAPACLSISPRCWRVQRDRSWSGSWSRRRWQWGRRLASSRRKSLRGSKRQRSQARCRQLCGSQPRW